MRHFKNIFFFILLCPLLCDAYTEWTVASYNCGGLSDHYDYLRAVCVQKVMQQRYASEPKLMSFNERIQQDALKDLFTDKGSWSDLQGDFQKLTLSSDDLESPNWRWNQMCQGMISSYKVRPVTLDDDEVIEMLQEHLLDLNRGVDENREQALKKGRATMAKRIFAHHLKFDLLCLQEADYLDASLFPTRYQVIFSNEVVGRNGIAFDKRRFKCLEVIGSVMERAFVVKLLDLDLGKKVLLVSAHLTGCHPYVGGEDARKGDAELRAIFNLLQDYEADFVLIGMDANVASTHPRMELIKEGGFSIDYTHFIEPTCTNPHLMLNTRIDWIIAKGNLGITNIPVLGVGLNSLESNMSDHKPVAASIVVY